VDVFSLLMVNRNYMGGTKRNNEFTTKQRISREIMKSIIMSTAIITSGYNYYNN